MALLSACAACAPVPAPPTAAANVFEQHEGFVDAHRTLIYYKTLGQGHPLLIVHGGPGMSHDYFLPYLLPLARTNKLVFIDERSSGRSEKLEDPSGYTVENMVEDIEGVRTSLGLGQINLLGHSGRRRTRPSLCTEIPSEPHTPDAVQYVRQHGRTQ